MDFEEWKRRRENEGKTVDTYNDMRTAGGVLTLVFGIGAIAIVVTSLALLLI